MFWFFWTYPYCTMLCLCLTFLQPIHQSVLNDVWQKAWSYANLCHNAHYLGQLDDRTICVSLAIRTCDVWHNMLSRICWSTWRSSIFLDMLTTEKGEAVLPHPSGHQPGLGAQGHHNRRPSPGLHCRGNQLQSLCLHRWVKLFCATKIVLQIWL